MTTEWIMYEATEKNTYHLPGHVTQNNDQKTFTLGYKESKSRKSKAYSCNKSLHTYFIW